MILSSRHWNEFYELNDLQILASVGISHIRIPYGYWMFDVESDEPFPEPSQNDEEGMRFYLKRMLTWAESVGIKVKCSIIVFKFTNAFNEIVRLFQISLRYLCLSVSICYWP